jgi:hypothetical protein
MRVVTCPYCRKEISDDGTLAGTNVCCPHCHGQFLMPSHDIAIALPVAASVDATMLRCPQFGSQDAQKVSMAHATGTSNITGIALGPGMGPMVGGAVHQSILARRLSPPARRQNPYGLAGCILLPVLMLPLMVVSVFALSSNDSPSHNAPIYIALAVAIPAAIFGFLVVVPFYDWEKKEKRRLARAGQEWSNKYICHRCGCVFK